MSAYQSQFTYSFDMAFTIAELASDVDIVLGSDWFSLVSLPFAGHSVAVDDRIMSFGSLSPRPLPRNASTSLHLPFICPLISLQIFHCPCQHSFIQIILHTPLHPLLAHHRRMQHCHKISMPMRVFHKVSTPMRVLNQVLSRCLNYLMMRI